MKIYDLSQPLNEQFPFWPYYPPFEVKYIKRKAEHGVNAQYIMTSNHMGTHLDAPRHFVTNGRTIDEIPVEWLCGPGVIVNLSDAMDELDLYTPKMIEDRVEVRKGDLLYLHTGWHKYGEAKLLSIISGTPASFAIFATASMSRTLICGLPMVSA